MTVRFDTKIAIAVRADLAQWQQLNVTAFRGPCSAVPAAELRFAGLALHGPRNAVDKVFKGVTLHP